MEKIYYTTINSYSSNGYWEEVYSSVRYFYNNSDLFQIKENGEIIPIPAKPKKEKISRWDLMLIEG